MLSLNVEGEGEDRPSRKRSQSPSRRGHRSAEYLLNCSSSSNNLPPRSHRTSESRTRRGRTSAEDDTEDERRPHPTSVSRTRSSSSREEKNSPQNRRHRSISRDRKTSVRAGPRLLTKSESKNDAAVSVRSQSRSRTQRGCPGPAEVKDDTMMNDRSESPARTRRGRHLNDAQETQLLVIYHTRQRSVSRTSKPAARRSNFSGSSGGGSSGLADPSLDRSERRNRPSQRSMKDEAASLSSGGRRAHRSLSRERRGRKTTASQPSLLENTAAPKSHSRRHRSISRTRRGQQP
jgi:hypothetical protein